MVIDACVEADRLVEGSALVSFAIVMVIGGVQRDLGTAADVAAGEGVANAAAALDESNRRNREVGEGEASDGKESRKCLHRVVMLQEGRACSVVVRAKVGCRKIVWWWREGGMERWT